eukprot:scaffold2830_cov131-Cylindrotheca_fusiformis.AAC.14
MPQRHVPFSFHCTICFESLNLSDRAPVVLPCGHTYICELCSKRLDKCMECRAPLKTTVTIPQHQQRTPSSPGAPTQNPGNGSYGGYRSSSFGNRGRNQIDSPSRRRQTETVSLPMPRNHVLMCLIETVQEGSNPEKSDGYESGDDDELVLRGMTVMGSSSGTYVVKEKAGLKVYPANSAIYPNHENEQSFLTLQYGQTVQINLFENRIATVARGGGYILIDNMSQLVKVSEVTDPACKLEASNKVLLSQIEELENKLHSMKRTQREVARKLKDTLADTENNSPFGPIPESVPKYSLDEEEEREPQHSQQHVHMETTSLPSKYIPKNSPVTESQSFDYARSVMPYTSKINCTSSFGDEAQLQSKANGLKGRRVRSQSQDNSWSFWPSIFGAPAPSQSATTSKGHRLQRPSNGPVGVGQMITDHVAPRHSTIDFSSGMSGHRGLNRTAKLNSQGHRNVRMMSHHSGARTYT